MEELFQRIKAHLERKSRRLGSKVTQKDFVIGLIEAALAEAEQAEADTDSAPEETAQEAPCEDGVATDEGVAFQPTENG